MLDEEIIRSILNTTPFISDQYDRWVIRAASDVPIRIKWDDCTDSGLYTVANYNNPYSQFFNTANAVIGSAGFSSQYFWNPPEDDRAGEVVDDGMIDAMFEGENN